MESLSLAEHILEILATKEGEYRRCAWCQTRRYDMIAKQGFTGFSITELAAFGLQVLQIGLALILGSGNLSFGRGETILWLFHIGKAIPIH